MAVLGGGCFWCTEAVFKMLTGVIAVAPGYAGGSVENPSYDAVSSGTTGHAEVIQITFDPNQITFEELLTVFFATHNPTTPNRQGNDVGTQYRSIIFYASNVQKDQAESFIAKLNASNTSGAPVITQVEPLTVFYPAESYHLDYYARNKSKPYCELVINPKLEKVQQQFSRLLKQQKK